MSTAPVETEDPFLEIAKGRYPLSDNMGAAKFWAPRDTMIPDPQPGEPNNTIESPGLCVPRPDRNVDTLWWTSLFGGLVGADHFYLRSPKTAIAKLLTLGGFGLWWLWDVLQISNERERVVRYGLVGPFDFFTGVGQGMITDKDIFYKQSVSFGTWLLGSLFGMFGVDQMMLGRGTLGLRYGIISSIVLFGTPFFQILFAPLFIAILGSWGANMSRIMSEPTKMFDKDSDGGLPMPSWSKEIMNYFAAYISDPSVMDAWGAKGIPGGELSKAFWIGHASDPKVGEGGANSKSSWVKAPFMVMLDTLLLIVKAIIEFILDIVEIFVPPLRAARLAQKSAAAAMSGDIKGMLGPGMSGIPGLSEIPGMSKLTKGVSGAMNQINKVGDSISSKIPDLTKLQESLPTRLTESLPTRLTESLPTRLTQSLQQLSHAEEDPQPQKGGAVSLSSESQILGAVVVALLGGGAVKYAVDYMMPQ